jgi:hypothetical protein
MKSLSELSVLCALAALCLTGRAGAESADSILGLPFGKPMDRTIKRCTYSGDLRSSDYCGMRDPLRAGQKNANVELSPPSATTMRIPTWVRSVTVKTDQAGRIELLWVWAGGVRDSGRVVESISERFGAGSQAGERGHSWDKPGVHIYFACTDLDTCAVIIRNEASQQKLEAAARERSRRNKF